MDTKHKEENDNKTRDMQKTDATIKAFDRVKDTISDYLAHQKVMTWAALGLLGGTALGIAKMYTDKHADVGSIHLVPQPKYFSSELLQWFSELSQYRSYHEKAYRLALINVDGVCMVKDIIVKTPQQFNNTWWMVSKRMLTYAMELLEVLNSECTVPNQCAHIRKLINSIFKYMYAMQKDMYQATRGRRIKSI